MCRRGNDSQIAVEMLSEHFKTNDTSGVSVIKDIIGGVNEWANIVDKNFPKY